VHVVQNDVTSTSNKQTYTLYSSTRVISAHRRTFVVACVMQLDPSSFHLFIVEQQTANKPPIYCI